MNELWLPYSQMYTIPAFPDRRSLYLSDREFLTKCFYEHPPRISEFTFTNLWAWRDAYRFALSAYDEMILLLAHHKSEAVLFPPIGKPLSAKQTVDILADAGATWNVAAIINVDVEQSPELATTQTLHMTEDRDRWDYVYSREKLVTLSGRKLHGKKNHLNAFLKSCAPRALSITAELLPAVQSFCDEWFVQHIPQRPEFVQEQRAVNIMLQHFIEFGLQGVAVELDGKIAAATWGEPLNAHTFVVHIEKARDDIRGLYQYVNQQFAASVPAQYALINREQDLGYEGLRRAKESYHPECYVRKAVVRLC